MESKGSPEYSEDKKSGYTLSLILWLIGLTALFAALWKTWPEVTLANSPFSAFWTLLWSEQLGLIPSIGFKLAYLVILGTVMLVSGVVVLVLSRQWFYVPAGETVFFECPFCKKQWRGHKNQKRVNCPYCREQTYARALFASYLKSALKIRKLFFDRGI